MLLENKAPESSEIGTAELKMGLPDLKIDPVGLKMVPFARGLISSQNCGSDPPLFVVQPYQKPYKNTDLAYFMRFHDASVSP